MCEPVSRGSQQRAAALLPRSGLPFEDGHLDLIRKHRKMVGQPVKHLSLLSIGCKIPDQRAFSSVFSELLCLCQVVFHTEPPFFYFPDFWRGNWQSQLI
jgi:hypothetical protein